ncbi:DUF58 domain-containing protein [Haloarchaeobius litoreus]|uniref:DUF58 domain-containing protein n=1 Tax=Haloarchaeobius litoreus TaxID=755306 RepID=A0ABD6DK69_9EURY|nr:DUF58 domain-containing protein [Haloarchaeobius litoreus]
MTRRDTGRWNVGFTVALVTGTLGLLVQNTVVFSAAAIGLCYAVYGYASRPPTLDLDVERTVADTSPMPGDEVEVTVTVRNAADEPLADLRILDGVPETLGVVEGSPRHMTGLQPDETETFTYTVKVRRGVHEFGDPTAIARNVSGSVEVTETVPLQSRLSCHAPVEDMHLADQTIPYPGRVETDSTGSGIEFHSIRQYHHSDPMNRIDWREFARSGELRTVEFRTDQAATIVVVVDTRREARVSRRPEEPDGVELGTYAAGRIAGHLLDAGNRVGLAQYGSSLGYLRPGTGEAQAARIRTNLDIQSVTSIPVRGTGSATDPGSDDSDDGDSAPSPGETDIGGRAATDGGWRVDWLRRRVPNGAQVVFVSPLLDDAPLDLLKRLRASGHALRVVSPDVTSTETPGSVVESIKRQQRLSALRNRTTDVIEWSPDEPLYAAIERATRRWQR